MVERRHAADPAVPPAAERAGGRAPAAAGDEGREGVVFRFGGRPVRPAALHDLEPAPNGRLRIAGPAPRVDFAAPSGFRARRGLYLRCVARPGHTVLRAARIELVGVSGERTSAQIRPEVFLGRSQFIEMRAPVAEARVEIGVHEGLIVLADLVLEPRPPLAALRHVGRVMLDRSGNTLFRKLRTAAGLVRSEGLAGVMQRVHSTGHSLGLEENRQGDPSRNYPAWNRLYGAGAPAAGDRPAAAAILLRPAGTPEDAAARARDALVAAGVAAARILETAPGAPIDAAALDGLSDGVAWLVVTGCDRVVHPAWLEAARAAAGGAGLVYADDDRRDPRGTPDDPDFKPGWDEHLALQQDYLGPLLVRPAAFEPAALACEDERNVRLALALAVARRGAAIARHEEVLSHRLAPDAGFAGAALSERSAIARAHLQDLGLDPDVVPHPELPTLAIAPRPARWPSVTVVIPTRDNMATLPLALETLLGTTDYPDLEVVVVDNGSRRQDVLDHLAAAAARDPRLRVVRHDHPFNFSELINVGAAAGSGELVLLLNDDVEITEALWLKAMAAHFARSETGVVGARLLFPDGSLQHAGVGLGVGGSVAGHIYLGLPVDTPLYHDRARLTRRVSAVTGACLLTSRALFDEIGGLDATRLKVAYNDIDYCLEAARRGRHVLYEPRATLIHHESHSRGRDDRPEKRQRLLAEIDHFSAKWGDLVFHDPFYNGNLSLFSPHFRFAHPPRRARREG